MNSGSLYPNVGPSSLGGGTFNEICGVMSNVITLIWNKWEYMSVNKLWTLICDKHEDRVSTFGQV